MGEYSQQATNLTGGYAQTEIGNYKNYWTEREGGDLLKRRCQFLRSYV